VIPRTRTTWSSRISFALGLAIAVGVFVWFGMRIAADWDELSGQLGLVSVGVLAVATLVQLAFNLLMSVCYYNSLRLAGAEVRARDGVSAYLATQLGKYLPGKVFYVAGHVGLGKWLRIPVARIAIGFTAHHIQIVSMGLLVASPVLGFAMGRPAVVATSVCAVAGVVVLAAGLWVRPFNALQRRRGKTELATFRPIYAIRAMVSAAIGWICYAIVTALLVSSMLPEASTAEIARAGAASVAAWLLGFLSFVAPAGMGVREGAFVVLTKGVITEPTAMAIALTTRLIYVGLQLPVGAVALAWSSRHRPGGGAAGDAPPAN